MVVGELLHSSSEGISASRVRERCETAKGSVTAKRDVGIYTVRIIKSVNLGEQRKDTRAETPGEKKGRKLRARARVLNFRTRTSDDAGRICDIHYM